MDLNLDLRKILRSCKFLKILTVLLLVFLVVLVFDAYISGPSKEEVVQESMEYIQNNLKRGEDVNLVSSHETDSSMYRLEVEMKDEGTLDLYVTEDGKYIFFERPTRTG